MTVSSISPPGSPDVRIGARPAAPKVRLFPSIRNGGRNKLIDLLRGFSILMVIVSHFSILNHVGVNYDAVIFGRTVDDVGGGLGYYGVAIFFVISGFLITSLTIRRYATLPAINFSEFWWLRFSRLMPMLGLCILAIVTFHAFGLGGFIFSDGTDLAKTIAALLSFRFNELVNSPTVPAVWNPLWSLSVEEMFYLCFPAACLFLNGAGAVIWLSVTLIASSVYLKLIGAVSPFGTMACVDLLALGCITALATPARLSAQPPYFGKKFAGVVLGTLGFGLIIFCVLRAHPFSTIWGPLFCGLGAALVLVSSQLVVLPKLVVIVLWPLAALGVVSYEAYLIHLPLHHYLFLFQFGNPWPCLLVVIAASALLHECFSEPMNQALRSFQSFSRRAVRSSGGAAEQETPRGRIYRRCLLLPIAPVVIIAALGFVMHRATVRPVEIKFAAIKDLPIATVEPIVSIGSNGGADLVFLRHERDGKITLGIDHWGGTAQISALLNPVALIGAGIRVDFGRDGVRVENADGLLVRTTTPPYTRCGRLHFGTNDIGFSLARARADSVFSHD